MFKAILFVLLMTYYVFPQSPDTLFIGFWNLENLFDTLDDPQKDDAEYLPTSEKGWDSLKLHQKMNNLSTVIKLMNDGRGPDLLGVCEVENESILTCFAKDYLDGIYGVAHLESPDNRGIDNALLYKTDKFKILSLRGDSVNLIDSYPTRLILRVTLLYEGDTLYVFVNHWPSRRSGELESEMNRIAAASELRSQVEKILLINPESKIFITGDFNDEPGNTSINEILKAEAFYCENMMMDIPGEGINRLFNLAFKKFEEGEGTYKFQGDWNMLDQIIVSKKILSGSIEYLCGSFEIFRPELMMTHEGKYKGTARPTFGGKNYLGGYSDHFPVTARFIKRLE